MKTEIRPEKEMKDSGIEWVGRIPDTWSVIPNKYVMNKEKNICEKWSGEDVMSLTMNGVIVRDLQNPTGKMPATFDGYQYIEDGDLLMCLFDIDVTPRCVGKVTHDGVTSPAYSNFKIHESASRDYFYYYYLMIDNTKELLHLAKNLRHSFTEEQLGQLKVPMPPLSEQQAIADYLDEVCSKIGDIIAEAKASIEEYKELKQAVIFEAVTKGLDKNVEMKDTGVKAIGKVNNKYNVAKIAELNDGLTDGTHGTYKRIDSGKLLLSSKNVQHNGLVIGMNESYISEEDSNYIVANGFPQKDDLLLCCIGASIGRCTLYPFDYPIAFQRSVIFIRCNKLILPKMMMYNLQSPSSFMQEQMVANMSAQAGLYQGLVKQIYIVVPPIDEQEQIITFLDKRTAEIDSLITEKEALIADLEAYKKSLIYELVTGKRRVV